MKRPYLIVTLFFALGVMASCNSDEQSAPENGDDLVKTVNVETETIQPQTFERFLRLVGTVESGNDVQLSAEVSGRIVRYYVDKGHRIAKGAAILKIDDSKLQREQARLQAQTEQAREKYERLNKIFEQDSIGAEIDVINAKATYEQSKSALESVQVDLRNTTVRAPFTGTLDEKMLDTGEMASPGIKLVRLIGSGDLKIVAGVPSRFSNAVTKGDKAEIWFDNQISDTLRLPLTFVGESIDKDSRTFRVEIELPRNSENYKVDMNANMKVRTFKQDSSIIVSKEYLYQKENGFAAYTVARADSGQTMARQQAVHLGPSYQNSVVIESGLHAGQELITVGSSFLQDSMRVKIVKKSDGELAEKNG